MRDFIWNDAIFQFVIFAILILIMLLIVLAIRETIKQFKQSGKKSMMSIIVNMALIFVLWVALEFIGVNPSYLVPNLIE